MRVRLEDAGLSVDGPRGDAPNLVVEVVNGTSVLGAVYGPVTPTEARILVDSLADGRDPAGPDVPWFAVASLAGVGAGLAAAASPMLTSGVFWSASDVALVVASDPVNASQAVRPVVDSGYVRDYAAGVVKPETAPFVGVHRMRAGDVARWAFPTARPVISTWCGPAVWDAPTLRGDAALASFLDAFAASVADLASRSPALPVSMSGGLDSTFIAATLARSTDRPVLGMTYSPLPGATLGLGPGIDADEAPLARLMADRFPGRITIDEVVNAARVRPLAAAAAVARRGGVPAFNPPNEPWMQRISAHAGAAGASMLFSGVNGNAAFSYDHPYAVAYCLKRAHLAHLVDMGRGPSGEWRMSDTRSRVLRPLRGVSRAETGPLASFGVGATAPSGPLSRSGYLDWLARRITGLAAASNPAAVNGVLIADPFSSQAVLRAAAAIEPSEWRRGGTSRAFARRAANGTLPEEIRLRTRRGQQGRDAWHVVRNDRDDYLDRVTHLRNIAGLEAVQPELLRDHVAAWPWATPEPPPWREHVALDRVLALAQFVNIWTEG